MAILGITSTQPAGLTSVIPSVIYLQTSDTYATVTTTGYLTQAKQEGFSFSNTQMALVYTTDDGPVWLQVAITYSNASVLSTIVSLIASSAPGDVILPTIANHLIVSTNTTGTLANRTGTAINNGSLQAGLSGTAGTLISYPGTALKGSLIVAGVANTGNTNTTISNAAMGQASVVSIPDPGATTAVFILSATAAAGQTITNGNLAVTAGNISAGSGGAAGAFYSFPPTASKGSLAITAVNNTGNTITTISNDAMGQASVVNIPDPGNAIGQFLVGATATPFVSGNLPKASGTAGLMVDSGIVATTIQLNTNIKAGVTANIGGSGAGPISVNVAGITTSSVVVATMASSSNSVSVLQAVSASGHFSITFSGDPGASAIVNYVVFIAPQ